MKQIILFAALLLITFCVTAQEAGQFSDKYQNIAERLLSTDGNLTIGGYGEVHFNQGIDPDIRKNASLDVHRMVMLFGYKFNERTRFITEIEFEHVSEVYIEQAFLQYKLNDYMNLRSGLLLIPMGLVNEYHEPVAFNGVERPVIDNVIAPTTWREIGIGFSGNILPVSMSYQAYLVNGFNGYNGSKGLLNGKSGFRSGRQKGAESYMSAPNFSGKVEYYGIRGLNLGLSGYFGKTQSVLYDGLDRNDTAEKALADSSAVGISMLGLDGRYNNSGLQLRGQLYLVGLSNTHEYNHFTGSPGKTNDLGKSMYGFYVEAGYNVLRAASDTQSELIPFLRLEGYDTHHKTDAYLTRNPAYLQSVITTGLTWKITPGSVMKLDMKFQKAEGADKFSRVLNAGIGVMF